MSEGPTRAGEPEAVETAVGAGPVDEADPRAVLADLARAALGHLEHRLAWRGGGIPRRALEDAARAQAAAWPAPAPRAERPAPPAPPAPLAPLAHPVPATPGPLPAGVPAPVGVPSAVPAPAGAPALQVVRDELGDCRRCKLHEGRTHIVFGVGNPDADLVFVGEAPGFHEDQQAEPFVGDAGQLLTKMIEAMGFRRSDVYICNVIKCRPPGNRNPEPDEIAACEPFLGKQLAALRPRMLVALGKFAAQVLTGKPTAPISALRGQFHAYRGIPVMATYHPAYLLRTPSQKRAVWEDLQKVLAELERVGIQPPLAPASRRG